MVRPVLLHLSTRGMAHYRHYVLLVQTSDKVPHAETQVCNPSPPSYGFSGCTGIRLGATYRPFLVKPADMKARNALGNPSDIS